MTPFPLPKLSQSGKEKLDALLANKIDHHELPALWLTACNADEVIYENQDGWKDYNKQDGPRVGPDTSETPRSQLQ